MAASRVPVTPKTRAARLRRRVMSWMNDLRYRWRALRLRRRQERELSEELSFHLEMETERLVEQGMTRREAGRTARIALGGIPGIQEECREAWGTRLLLDLMRDLHGGLRRVVKEPRFAALVVASLTLGIGSVAVIFSMIDAVLLRPLPFGELQRIVAFQEIEPGGDLFSTSDANMLDFETRARTVEAIAGIVFPQPRPALRQKGDRVQLSAYSVTPRFFEVLGVDAHLGRTFHHDEGPPGTSPRVAVFGHGAWQRLFGGDPQLVGRDIDLDGELYTVLGILPAGFRYGDRVDVYLPYVPDPSFPRGDHRLDAVARLAPGVDLTAAQTEVTAVAAQLATEYPDSNTGWGVDLRPVEEYFLGAELRRNHLVLFGAVALLLLLTCVNVSGLLLARLGDRDREIQLRRVLGASRGRVLGQLLVESLMLGLLGAVGGLLLAAATVPVVRSLPVPVPRLDEMVVDLRVVCVVAAVAVVAALLFGLAPAWRLASHRGTGALTAGAQGSDRQSTRLRSALVAFEVALATVLAMGAGLLSQSFSTLQQVDSGFDPTGVLLAQIDLPVERYSESTSTGAFYDRLLERVEALPGVHSAGATIVSPFRGPRPSNVVGTETMLEREAFTRVQWRCVTPHLFRTLGIPLLRGRDFTAVGEPRREAVISERLASRLWPGEDPLGKKLRWISPRGAAPRSDRRGGGGAGSGTRRRATVHGLPAATHHGLARHASGHPFRPAGGIPRRRAAHRLARTRSAARATCPAHLRQSASRGPGPAALEPTSDVVILPPRRIPGHVGHLWHCRLRREPPPPRVGTACGAGRPS